MSGWTIGYIVGAAVALVVVAVLLLMIVGARRAAGRAEEIAATLDELRQGTVGLWELQDVNLTAERIADTVTGRQSAERTGGRAGE